MPFDCNAMTPSICILVLYTPSILYLSSALCTIFYELCLLLLLLIRSIITNYYYYYYEEEKTDSIASIKILIILDFSWLVICGAIASVVNSQ